MCDFGAISGPTALAIAGLVATAASTTVAVAGQMQATQSANDAAEYQTKVAQRNAEVQNMQADNATQEGIVAEKQHRLLVSGLEGSQRAAGAGSGLLVDDGSNLQTQQDTAGFGELDALTIRNNAARQAWALKNQANDTEAQGMLASMRKSDGTLAAAGSLLNGVSSIGQQYYTAKQNGVFK